ncbi:MAG: hypothetical protein ACI4XP_05060 [Acutalibacteraceae bacterium]
MKKYQEKQNLEKQTAGSAYIENDKICKTYGLSVIENESGLKGIDQITQKLAKQGKSWKVDLCKALDEATKICNSKNGFVYEK